MRSKVFEAAGWSSQLATTAVDSTGLYITRSPNLVTYAAEKLKLTSQAASPAPSTFPR